MPPKRKRASLAATATTSTTTTFSRNKKQKVASSATSDEQTPNSSIIAEQHPHGQVDSDQYYTVRNIIDEDAKRYKIDWEDGPGGVKYSPTWEPKRLANKSAVLAWREIKAERKRLEREREREREKERERARERIAGPSRTFATSGTLASGSEAQSSPAGRKQRKGTTPRAVSEGSQSRSRSREKSPERSRARSRERSRKQSSQLLDSPAPETAASYRDESGDHDGHDDASNQETRQSLEEEEEEEEEGGGGGETSVEAGSTSAEKDLLEIQDSYPDTAVQRGLPAEQVQLPRNQDQDQDTQAESKQFPRPARRRSAISPEVRITPRPRAADDEIDYSTFPSSQVIFGTQPHRASSSEPSQPSQLAVDAAAVPNLTQKHSQYEPEDTSRSEDSTASAIVTSSSSVHTFATTQQFPVGAIIPDSQSLNDSNSYNPNKSEESYEPSGQPQSQFQSEIQSGLQPRSAKATASQELSHSSTQVIPESSLPQRLQPPDIDTLQGNTPRPKGQSFLDVVLASPIGIAAKKVEAFGSVASPTLPAASRTSSSTSSPHPTLSPDKSQSQSQHFETQQAQPSQFALPAHLSTQHAAQRPDPIDLDTASSITQRGLASYRVDNPFESAPLQIESNQVPSTQVPDQSLPVSLSSFLPQGSTADPSARAIGPIQQSVDSRQKEARDYSAGPLARATSPVQRSVDIKQNEIQDRSTGSPIRFFTQVHVAARSVPVSSAIPSLPSQDVGTLGDSAPPLPYFTVFARTPTPHRTLSRMSSATPTSIKGKGVIAERLAARRAAGRVSATTTASPKPASAVPARLQSPALQDRETRSPSMIPAIEARVQEPPEEYFRSERYETLLPGDEPDIQGAAMTFEPLSRSVDLRSVRAVPINFGEQQRDHYKQTITYRKDLINDFTSKVWPADSLQASKARVLFDELRKIVLHPDLVNEEAYTQSSQVDTAYKAQWDMDTSTKFRFLKHYLAAANVFNLHTLLLVQPGRIVQMLQIFLEGNDVDFCVSSDVDGTRYVNGTRSKPAVTIFTMDCKAAGIPSPDLIISLQGDISDLQVSSLQSHFSRDDPPIPAVSLVIPKTIEHIERVMPRQTSEAERLHVLVGTVTSYRSEAGREREGTDTADKAASSLVNFVLNPLSWPFDELPDIKLFEPVSASQASSESFSEELNGHGTKRAMDTDAEEQQSVKRAKALKPSETVPEQTGTSHISDSIDFASQHAATIKAMETALRKSQAQLREHIQALETLQYQHEDQRQSLVQAESDRDKAIETAQAATLRIAILQASLGDLRAERSSLQDQLREAKEVVLNHAIPERAEFEALKQAAVVAAAEQMRLLNKVKSTEESLDYLRDQYQTASNSAAHEGKANAALEAQVADLERRASGEQLKLRGKTLDTHSRNLSSTNKQLALMLKSREELLQRKEEEITKLKESGRGRMNTRQSSVPRTPRIGSPLAAGVTSRQGSPAAGKLPHPLRNAR